MTVIDNTAQWKVKKVGALPHAVMSGAAAGADGASGLVPAPAAGDQDKVLKGDGSWGEVSLASMGVTASAAELNKLDGLTTTTTELNYIDGVTSNIQTQLDGKLGSTAQAADSAKLGGTAASSYAKLASPTFTGTVTAPTLTVSTTLNIPGGKIWIAEED